MALFFCRSDPGGSIIEGLEIDKYGDILNWPPNFFGDELGDVFAQAEIASTGRLESKED